MEKSKVKYTQGLSFLPGSSSDTYEGINTARMREERAAKAKKEMKKQGVAAMVVTGALNVRYLTGFHWYEYSPYLSYCLFFAEGDPIIFAHAGSYQQMPEEMPWVKHWRIARSTCGDIGTAAAIKEEYDLFAKEIQQELQQRKLENEKLGIIGFDTWAREALKAKGLNVVEAFALLMDACKCKTVDEVNCLRLAADMVGVGWQRFMDYARPGMTTGEVHREVYQAISAAGADHVGGFPISGPMTFERCVTIMPRRINKGDMLYYPLCGTSYLAYTACLYRSFKMGADPTAQEKGWYNRVKDTLDTCVEATKIGNTTADVAKCFPPASKWGYKDEADVLTIEFGHGIGLVDGNSSHVHYNHPVINRYWSLKHPQPFEEGMVIAYESCEGEHRIGGARLEYDIVVTKDGPVRLDSFPADEIMVVGT